MNPIDILIIVFSVLLFVFYIYQGLYIIMALTHNPPYFEEKGQYRYAFLISAKNEENCIKYLVKSIKRQKYPKDLYTIFVCADNCDDNTAEVARTAGAVVYERHDESRPGKGYALDYMIKKIRDDYGYDSFDGYFIFDADNLLDENYLAEMNKLFSNGYRIITSYRNSKNYDSNWVSASSGMWFLREARHLNRGRMLLGISCMVSGTGYVIHKDIIKAQDGWPYYKLTEDVEFSVNNILAGEKIAYCSRAVFYDEQPIHFTDSWKQRLRWTKGFYQVLFDKGGALFAGMFKKGGFACYDVLTIISPGVVFTFNCVASAVLLMIKADFVPEVFIKLTGQQILTATVGTYILAFLLGLMVTVTEWNKILCSGIKKVLYLFTFPIFMLSYVPIAILALFVDVKWSQIKHPVAISDEDMLTRWKRKK